MQCSPQLGFVIRLGDSIYSDGKLLRSSALIYVPRSSAALKRCTRSLYSNQPKPKQITNPNPNTRVCVFGEVGQEAEGRADYQQADTTSISTNAARTAAVSINFNCTNGGGINETRAVTQKVGAGLIARTVTLKAAVSLLLTSLNLEA
ncbi:hypothetical protein B0H14DRAFT_2628363 [Mycena olivaceomarginata]|nr:hypothetical protein B0H14DRAFT_2628363 [Mycena olivaceomarginata]